MLCTFDQVSICGHLHRLRCQQAGKHMNTPGRSGTGSDLTGLLLLLDRVWDRVQLRG